MVKPLFDVILVVTVMERRTRRTGEEEGSVRLYIFMILCFQLLLTTATVFINTPLNSSLSTGPR